MSVICDDPIPDDVLEAFRLRHAPISKAEALCLRPVIDRSGPPAIWDGASTTTTSQPPVSLGDLAAMAERWAGPKYTKYITTRAIEHELRKRIEADVSPAVSIFGIPIWSYPTKHEAVMAAFEMRDKGESVCLITDDPPGPE